VLGSAIRRAKAIITPSEFTRERLKNFFPSAAGKINIINEGVVSLRGEAENGAIEKGGIEKPYLLYVGNAYPHKNLETLIKAVSALNELGKKFKLVLVGREDDFYARLKKKFGYKDFVTFYGKAEEEELRRLYENAHAYVFPSFQEGFGLPGLEAMAQGVPVVAANAGALKEVYGDAAKYFDPRDVRSLVKAILSLDEPEVRERLKFNGFKQIAKYNWQNAAKNTLALYEKTEEKISA
jgi:glycosyltransferase involved in cell wall biosynthesis